MKNQYQKLIDNSTDTSNRENQLDFEFYITDGIVLKTMVRSNPGLIYLENGVVKGKWHENDVPEIHELN